GIVPPKEWDARYDEINRFDEESVEDGTTIAKVAPLVSYEEQRSQHTAPPGRPDKIGNYTATDAASQPNEPSYQAAHQAAISRTSTETAPWYAIPADRKWFARLAVSELLLDALRGLDLCWPPADFDVEAEKKRLAAT